MAKKRVACPKCQSKKSIPILYGEPTLKAIEEVEAGKYMLGGCCFSDQSPTRHCRDCGHEWKPEPSNPV